MAPAAHIVVDTDALLRVERQRRRDIQRAFSRYVPPQLVEHLVAHPETTDLGAETRELTILFAHIRGFTSMSEALKDDPQRLGRLINTVLGALADIVVAHGGTIDKCVGDSVMAFWGAPHADPHHARHAAAAAAMTSMAPPARAASQGSVTATP